MEGKISSSSHTQLIWLWTSCYQVIWLVKAQMIVWLVVDHQQEFRWSLSLIHTQEVTWLSMVARSEYFPLSDLRVIFLLTYSSWRTWYEKARADIYQLIVFIWWECQTSSKLLRVIVSRDVSVRHTLMSARTRRDPTNARRWSRSGMEMGIDHDMWSFILVVSRS